MLSESIPDKVPGRASSYDRLTELSRAAVITTNPAGRIPDEFRSRVRERIEHCLGDISPEGASDEPLTSNELYQERGIAISLVVRGERLSKMELERFREATVAKILIAALEKLDA